MSERLYVQHGQLRQLVDVRSGKEGEEAEEEEVSSSVWLVATYSDDSQNESFTIECRVSSRVESL